MHWERVAEHAPWTPRIWFSAAVYRDRLWILGGWSNHPSKNRGDVWYSRDGKEWAQLRSNVVWKERHEHSTYVLRDRIWVAGGHAQPLSSEVWSLEVPRDWFEAKPAEKMGLHSAVEGEAARMIERCRVGATCRLGTVSALARE